MIIFRCDSKQYIPKNGVPELNDVPADFLRQAKKEGLPTMKQPTDEECKEVEEQVSREWALIGDTFLAYPYPVCGLYLFDDAAYSGELAGADGICCNRSNEESETKFSIEKQREIKRNPAALSVYLLCGGCKRQYRL